MICTIFFFKQKTAYEMRISDWSSDVCSSDLSAHRAREISGGSELTIDRDRDKNPVVALREIAEQTVRPRDIQDSLVGSLQKVVVDDDDTPDEISSISRSDEALRLTAAAPPRSSDVRRGGKECVSLCRSVWWTSY